MKIFIVGLPGSGRTSVAKHLSNQENFRYVDATGWAKSTFRDRNPDEHIQQYNDEYHHYLVHRMKINPDLFINNVNESIKSYSGNHTFVIDGVNSPRDLAQLFDYNQDFIVFLNRTDAEPEFRDYENVGLSVMRDYCFWMSSAFLLPKERWLEYNFKIPGEESDFVKSLGSKNSVFIVKTISRVCSHLREKINSHLREVEDKL
jgi:hypothetical protein